MQQIYKPSTTNNDSVAFCYQGNVKEAPTLKGAVTRPVAEKLLCEHFKDSVTPFSHQSAETISRFKDGTFGMSSLSMALYANGLSPRGVNPENPCGLLYSDGEVTFGIGYFSGCLHFIAPRGENTAAAISRFVSAIRAIDPFKATPIYIRHLKHETCAQLLSLGWLDARERPFLAEAPLEDETFSASIITLDEVMFETNDSFTIRTLTNGESKSSRTKNRHSFNSFSAFMTRNDITLELHPYSSEHRASAECIGKRHFQVLEKSGKAIGSCWQDYSNLINCKLLDSLGSAVFSRIGFLRRSEHRVPFMLFIGEDLSASRFGLYCSLTMRYPEIVCPLLGLADSDKGFRSNASTYAHLMFFDELRTQGYQEVHLGGSETADLNRFKRRLGARSAQSYWVVSDSR